MENLNDLLILEEFMDFQEWVKSQFSLEILKNGRISFKTPCITYSFTEEEFEFLKKLFNEFNY